jgi:hypothetical protein
MTAHTRRRIRWTLARLASTSVTLLSLRLAAVVLGTPTAAVLAALVFVVWALSWWARVVEPRVFAPRPTQSTPKRLPVAGPLPLDGDRHLAFAQALAVVAARYLAECEEAARANRSLDGQP